jgi:nicotinamidase-related amidase
MGRIWDDVVSDRDREIYRAAGYTKRMGGGQNPALLVVDITYNFTGDKPEPVLESIKRFSDSCGEAAWESMKHTRRLLDLCRAQKIPVIYTKAVENRSPLMLGGWTWKNARAANLTDIQKKIGNQIAEPVAPQPGEIVIQQTGPRGFFGPALGRYLINLKVDTVIITGTTTSGCVRATVYDALAYGFRILIPEECVFDRGDLAHKASLFDMDRYGDVVPLGEVVDYLTSLRPASVTAV